jgi:hypothetical protein
MKNHSLGPRSCSETMGPFDIWYVSLNGERNRREEDTTQRNANVHLFSERDRNFRSKGSSGAWKHTPYIARSQ